MFKTVVTEQEKKNIFSTLPMFKPSKAASLEETLLGLEFENEIDTQRPEFQEFPGWISVPGWKKHNEGSLRGYGFEHVSMPIPYSQVHEDVNYLFDSLRYQLQCYSGGDYGSNLPFTNSIRTSLHVHFDVGLMNSVQITNFACVYWILEPFIQHFCGNHRISNLFCLRLMDSSFMKLFLKETLDRDSTLMHSAISQESFRYGSINFNSLAKFGTLEFRIMRGVSSAKDALIWIEVLESIRKFSLQFQSTNELRDFFLDACVASEFPRIVLGLPNYTTLLSYFPTNKNLTEEIQEGFGTVSQILASNTKKGATYKRFEVKHIPNDPQEQPVIVESSTSPWHLDTTPAIIGGGYQEHLHQILFGIAPQTNLMADVFSEPSSEPAPLHLAELVADIEDNEDDWDSGDDVMPEWEDDETDLPVPGDEGDDLDF